MLLLFWRGRAATLTAGVAPAAVSSAVATLTGSRAALLVAVPATATAGARIAALALDTTLAGELAGATASAFAGILQQTQGSGDITLAPPFINGDGAYSYVGLSGIEMPPPVLDGLGAAPVWGDGGLTIPQPLLVAAGYINITASGAIIVGTPLLVGVGILRFTGSGAVTMARPILVGYGPPFPPGPLPTLPPTDVHVIEAYDINGVLLGRVQPIRRAKFTMVENDVGDFEVELPWIYDDVINIMQTRNRIEYSIKGIRVFGGIIMKRQFRQEGRYSMVTLSGPGYNGFLTGRIVVPPPGAADDVYVNVRADDLVKNLVRNHLGANAPVARRAQGFTVDINRGLSSFVTNYNGRYETLIDALKNITKEATDVKFLTVRGADGLLQFRTFVPIIGREKGIGSPDTVLFDMAGGNALNVEYVEDGTSIRNYIYGGGPGDDAARMIQQGQNLESINDWGRIEEFLDSSGVTTTAELDLEILKKLEETSRGGPSLSFTVGQAGRYEYPLDFAFGDRVSAIWKEAGLTLTDVISGITLNLEESGSLGIEMSIGAPNLFRLSPGRALARFIRGIRGEVGLMQRH